MGNASSAARLYTGSIGNKKSTIRGVTGGDTKDGHKTTQVIEGKEKDAGESRDRSKGKSEDKEGK
jgi:hypothetical protein